MPRRNPNHRAVAVAKSKSAPDNLLEGALWNLYRGMEVDESVTRAAEINVSAARDCMHGWLLATDKDEEISRRTRIPIEVVQAYRYLFFDVTVFRDHMDLVDWVRRISEVPGTTPEAMQYIRWAIMYGTEAVAYMSGLPVVLDPSTVQAQAMENGHFRALMGREAHIDSPTAREALKHQQMAVSQALVLGKKAPGTDNVALRLKFREMTSKIEVEDKTMEVLH